MFPLTHVYVTSEVAGNNTYTIIGSTLLDLPIIAQGKLNWSHGKINAVGTNGTGYSFQWFDNRFPKLKGIKGHNVPEYFLELYVAKAHPEVFGLLKMQLSVRKQVI